MQHKIRLWQLETSNKKIKASYIKIYKAFIFCNKQYAKNEMESATLCLYITKKEYYF